MAGVQTIQIPLLLGNDQYVMGTAEFMEDGSNAKMVLSVTASGADASDLVATMTSGELLALKFVAIPVTRRNTNLDKGTNI